MNLEAYGMALRTVAGDYHAQQQDRLFSEVIQLSDHIVEKARQQGGGLIFPGRSLIACAAYIEKKYPDISLVMILI